jgi:hypothetical protein
MITESLKVVKMNINLCGSKFVLIMINVDGSQEFFTGLLVIHKLSIWDNTGIQHLVSMKDCKIYQNALYLLIKSLQQEMVFSCGVIYTSV